MRTALFLLMLLVCVPVQAEMTLVTINLHHRPAKDLVSILQPMLDKGGSISGAGYKLFIRSSPENIAQLRHMLQSIDVAARNLLVSVSLDPAVLQENKHASLQANIKQGEVTLQTDGNRRTTADTNGHEHHRNHIMYDPRLFQQAQTERAPQVQTVRVSEGLWATIKTGQAIPVASRTRNPDGTVTDTYTYQAVATGFQVLPRVNGDNVTLTIRPQAQTLSTSKAGTYDTTEMNTTVSGKLGQWIPLGSVAQTQQTNNSGITYRTETRDDTNTQFYVKVELAKP